MIEFSDDKKKGSFGLFKGKIFINLIVIVVLLIGSILLITFSLGKDKIVTINYNDNGSTNYKVYLKENEFYDSEYLQPNMTYIASIIDYVDIDFNYNFNVDRASILDYEYSVIGTLQISPTTNKGKVLFSKDYTLLDKVNKNVSDATSYNLVQNIKLDYGKYNDLASSFKTTYGVDCESKLVVKLVVDTLGKDLEYETNFNNSSDTSIILPLSSKQIDVTIDSANIDKNSFVNNNIAPKLTDKVLLVIGIVLGVGCFVLILLTLKQFISNRPVKDKYLEAVKKILNDYDRAIVETTRIPEDVDHDMYEVTKFSEILDARDNLRVPISYVNIDDDNCCFYVKKENLVYIYYINREDVENEKSI